MEKQAEEMVAAGTPQQDLLCWLQGARETVSERLAPYPGPQHEERPMVNAGLRENPREFGVELANRFVSLQSEGYTGQEATSRLAGDVALRANAMVAQGLECEDARAWIEEVEGAFRKRLDAVLIDLAERHVAEEEPPAVFEAQKLVRVANFIQRDFRRSSNRCADPTQSSRQWNGVCRPPKEQ